MKTSQYATPITLIIATLAGALLAQLVGGAVNGRHYMMLHNMPAVANGGAVGLLVFLIMLAVGGFIAARLTARE